MAVEPTADAQSPVFVESKGAPCQSGITRIGSHLMGQMRESSVERPGATRHRAEFRRETALPALDSALFEDFVPISPPIPIPGSSDV
jgi:hypothetical protein